MEIPRRPVLDDGHVRVRAPRVEDAERLLEAALDPDYQRWTSVPVPVTLEDQRGFLGEVLPAAWAQGRSWGLAVEHEGRLAGLVELRPDDDRAAGVAEIAFGAHPDVRGRAVDGSSVMERGLRLVLAWAFEEAGVHTVWWRAHRGNWASRRLAWKVGFRVEGRVRQWVTQRGTRHDAWVGSLLREDPREPVTPWLRPAVLHGADVRLRPFSPADVPAVVEACSDTRTAHWLGRLPAPYTRADAEDYLLGVEEGHAEGRGVTWAVADAADDTLVGSMGLFDLDPGEQCEIGYWAHPAVRGRGLTTQAADLALRYAFGVLGVRRVVASAAADNAASLHVLESVGLRRLGVERRGAVLRTGRADQVRLDLLREGWTPVPRSTLT